MRIGTAVPTEEQRARVRHYFIQDRSVTVNYTAGMYEAEALDLIDRLFAEGHETLVVTGGSMLYIDALCYGLDDFPEVPMMLREHLMECLRDEGVDVLADQLKELDPVTYDEIDLSNGQRVIRALEVCLYTGQPFSSFKTRSFKERAFEIEKIGLQRPREELYARIDSRVLHMMEEGLEAASPPDGGLPRNVRVFRREARPGGDRPSHPAQHPALRQAPAHLVAPRPVHPVD